MREKYIQIDGIVTNYIVNTNGEVRNSKTNKLLKGSISRSGYRYYRLSINGEKKRIYGHILVAQAFIGDIKEKMIVNHIDGNKINNNVDNLEIISKSENIKHAHENGLIKPNHEKKQEIKNLIDEIWLPIEDFSDYYVSNKGRIKSCKRKIPIELKPSIINGYYKISLCNNGKVKSFLVHQLVYMTFTKDWDLKGYVIDHIDNNPFNNKIENLRKLTYKENTQAAYTEQKAFKNIRKVLAFKNDVLIGEYQSCADAARKLKLDGSAISKVCRNIYSHTHGYTFKYKE